MSPNNKWIFFIIVGVTVIQWVYGKLQEQAAQKRAQGRLAQRPSAKTPAAGSTSPTRRVGASQTLTQADLQARRQAQLRALRERQARLLQRRSPGPPQSPRRTPTAPAPAAARPPRPTTTPPRQTVRAPLPSAVARAQTSRPSQRPPAQTRRLPSEQGKKKSSSMHIMQQVHERQAAELRRGLVATPPPAAPASSSVRPRTQNDWRRAIIASELRAPPISLRPTAE